MQEEQRSLCSVQTLSVLELLRDRSVRWQVLTVMVVNAGMQLSGIDAVRLLSGELSAYVCVCVCVFLIIGCVCLCVCVFDHWMCVCVCF